MPNVKITTLVENTVTASLSPLMAEHGLSFLIQTPDQTILFDTGQGLAIVNNAAALGIDLDKVDTLVLSHAHFDHGGGLKQVLTVNNHFTLVAHPEIYEPKYVGGNGQFAPIGIEKDIDLLKDTPVKMIIGTDPVDLGQGIMTTGVIPLATDFEDVEPMFFKEKNTEKFPDLIEDDNALIIDTPKGIVVVLGCAHRGIINTLNHVSALTGKSDIHAIMGGLHLMFADPEKLQKVATAFRKFNIDRFIIGHCTGFHAVTAMVNEFKDKVVQNTVGHVIEF